MFLVSMKSILLIIPHPPITHPFLLMPPMYETNCSLEYLYQLSVAFVVNLQFFLYTLNLTSGRHSSVKINTLETVTTDLLNTLCS